MRTAEQKAEHAAYMRQWYASKPGYKAAADRKHREKYLDKLRAYDRVRRNNPEGKEYRKMASRKQRAKDPEAARKYHHEHYMRNRERALRQQKERRERLGAVLLERQRWYGIKHSHGITKEEWDAMLKAQGGVCGICGGPPCGRSKQWHVDHDHSTGIIRGLLCMKCNHALERIDNCPDWVERALEWVARGWKVAA